MSGINTLYDSYTNAPVNSKYSTGKVKETKADKTADKTGEAAEKTAEKVEKRADSFERTDKSVKNNTYTKGIATEHAGKSELAIKNEGMKDMVAQLLGQATNASGNKKGLTLESIMKSYGLDYIESDGSEDFWGAEKTANRILDFAKSLAGDDPEKFKQVKAAFEKGFGECEKIWGDKLPGVCYDTLDNVRKGFDDWEKELGSGSDAAAAAATD
ncbi:MAG: hypothetical protein IK093_00640 [Ruminiclostridium sp.]|nr:hypothetical protein [Ruminiclostridium sp.]